LPSKYLITGGAGFIGSHIAEALSREGQEVTILDNLSTGKRENLKSFEREVNFIEGDIRDAATVRQATQGVEYVIHQAALASVERSVRDPITTSEVNVQGTLNVLQAAKSAGVKRVVYASSSSVYGDSDVLPKVEAMEPNPKSPYAISKLAGEWYCRVTSDLFDLPTVSLRYFNVFGPRQDPASQYAAVIPIFVTSLLRKKAPTIYGDGEQSRDFTYVDNVVAANLLACHSQNSGGQVFNVACGDRFSLNSLLEKLKRLTGIELDATHGPERVGDVKHSQASIEAIAGVLGHAPAIDFEQGLKNTVEWYQQVSQAV
jgi:UDP-glucose 4-epimerase